MVEGRERGEEVEKRWKRGEGDREGRGGGGRAFVPMRLNYKMI